jgi:hypothetical protein
MWYALLIPVLLSLVAYKWFSYKITIGELFIPFGACLLSIVISYFVIKDKVMEDVEYQGHLVVEARYYENWATWRTETCSRTYSCNCDSKGSCQTCTEYYDCSYCDDNDAYWEVITDDGRSIHISQSYYNSLKVKWGATPQFVELNRSIDYSHGCGKDGNMYRIVWNGLPETSEATVTEFDFVNPVKASHSAFQYTLIEPEEADSLGLFSYPKFYDYYKQPCLLSKNWRFSSKDMTKFEYLNGYMGPRNKVKIFTLLFKDKPIDIAFKQEQYWQGGNQNELVVCIGVDSNWKINWVKPFSWCDNKRICVDTREDIASLKYLNLDSVYRVYEKNIPLFFHYKSFKDFNYLQFEPTSGQIAFVYIITLVVSILSILFIIKNDIEPWKHTRNIATGWLK